MDTNTRCTSRDKSSLKISSTTSICLLTVVTALASIIPSSCLELWQASNRVHRISESKVRKTYFISSTSHKPGAGSTISPLNRVACIVSVFLAGAPSRSICFLCISVRSFSLKTSTVDASENVI